MLPQSFSLDAAMMTYPPASVCSEGTESIQRFLCSGEASHLLLTHSFSKMMEMERKNARIAIAVFKDLIYPARFKIIPSTL